MIMLGFSVERIDQAQLVCSEHGGLASISRREFQCASGAIFRW